MEQCGQHVDVASVGELNGDRDPVASDVAVSVAGEQCVPHVIKRDVGIDEIVDPRELNLPENGHEVGIAKSANRRVSGEASDSAVTGNLEYGSK